MNFSNSYQMICNDCGEKYEADSFRLSCDRHHPPALLRAVYPQKQLQKKTLPGIFQYIDWLPIERHLEIEGKPITYHSEKLGHHLGLDNLFISFNGYFPEKNAKLLTCSFKELEAYTVLARIPQNYPLTLVVASAGNTGRAFTSICSELNIPFLLVIPEKNTSAIFSHKPYNDCVQMVVVVNSDNYSDAINLAKKISNLEGYFPEGGVQNIARRAGLGIPVIDAVMEIGRIPHHYFQAIGSGSGGIAAYEANLLFLEDGRFGNNYMKLHLSQNTPFTPIVNAWQSSSSEINYSSDVETRKQIRGVIAKVLTNQNPAYSVTGGLYEALTKTQGEMYAVTNEELEKTRILFESLEGIDISPSAGVATASLIQAINLRKVRKNDYILLNITSGGVKKFKQDYQIYSLLPSKIG